MTTTTSFLNSAHRFIGAHENDGNRWGVGDTVNIFLADFEHTEFKDTSEFELLSATALAASGVALLSLILM